MTDKPKKNSYAKLQIGTIHTIHKDIIRFDMNDKLHLPPPAFGTFISVTAENKDIYGVIYNATTKEGLYPSTAANKSQMPDAEYLHKQKHSIRIKIELHALLIGNPNQECNFLENFYRPKSLFHKPVYIPDHHEVRIFFENFDYMKKFFSYDCSIPAEELCVVLLRRFISFFGCQPDYETILEQKIKRLFAEQPERADILLKRIGSYKWR